jgi:SpoVK/Ycf46/Vps4 family AAA+-type ATPase
MANIIRKLDTIKNRSILKNNILNINDRKLSKQEILNLLMLYDNTYYMTQTDPYINNATLSLRQKELIITKIPYTINFKINSIKDLISICDNYGTIQNIREDAKLNLLIKIHKPLLDLNSLIGMSELKNDILNQILFYIQNFHKVNNMEYMHTVLCGPPGTGKTEVAKIIGEIFSKLNILSKGTFTKVVRSDLIAGYLGQTAIKTTKVIENSLGGVLFIDEAYSLGNQEKRDSFAKECLDTLCEALSNHKDNLMIIIAGYEEELNSCFFSFNPGLRSRFPWTFKTDKYSPEDLFKIFCKKVQEINWKINNSLDENFFKKHIKHFKHYGRDVELFLSKCKIAHARRVFSLPDDQKTIISKEDLDEGLKLFIKHGIQCENTFDTIGHLYN